MRCVQVCLAAADAPIDCWAAGRPAGRVVARAVVVPRRHALRRVTVCAPVVRRGKGRVAHVRCRPRLQQTLPSATSGAVEACVEAAAEEEAGLDGDRGAAASGDATVVAEGGCDAPQQPAVLAAGVGLGGQGEHPEGAVRVAVAGCTAARLRRAHDAVGVLGRALRVGGVRVGEDRCTRAAISAGNIDGGGGSGGGGTGEEGGRSGYVLAAGVLHVEGARDRVDFDLGCKRGEQQERAGQQ